MPPKKAAAAPAAKKAPAKAQPAKAPAKAAPAKKAGAPAPAKKAAAAPKVQEEKKEEEKIVEQPKVVEPPKEPVIGESVIKYSTYKTAFKHKDGMLKWEDIDEEYCFSCAFEENNYELKLRKEEEEGVYLKMEAEIFYGLQDGTTYVCEVKEHPYVMVRKVKAEGEESEEEEKKAGEAEEEPEEEINPALGQADDPRDPKNLTAFHRIVVHPENE